MKDYDRVARGILASLLISVSASAQNAERSAARSHIGPTLEEIVVTADRKDSFGAEFVQAGTFRNQRTIDTPLTIATFTKDLLRSQQASTVADAARNTAGVTSAQINNVVYSNLSVRGVAADNMTNFRLNGILPIVNLIDMPLENKERVEVLKGASGLYYGFATPAGIVNLATERPTVEPLSAVELFGNSNGALGGGFDTSRAWANSGLRINAAASTLETGIDRTRGDRRFVSLAYDWEPSDELVFELDGEYIYKTVTEPTQFALPAPVDGVIPLPSLQDPRSNVGAEWMQGEGSEYNVLSRARYSLSPAWSLSLAGGISSVSVDRRYSSFSRYDLVTGDGMLNVAMTSGRDHDSIIFRGDAAGAFRTGWVEHELLIGASRNIRKNLIPTAARASFSQNLYAPVQIPELPKPPRLIANPSEVTDLGYYILDRAKLSDRLLLTLGYRKTDYRDVSRASSYEASPDSLSYAVMVKPRDWLGVYATYIEGLESGGIAQQIAANAGEILPAAISEQRELGIKLKPAPGLLVTLAYFDVERASSYLNSSNFFVQDGRAGYRGIEFSATGELTGSLSIAASALSCKAEQESGAAAIVGKRIENSAEFTGSLFLEYKVPLVSGLKVSVGAFHVGNRAVNAANDAFAPGYTTYDLGASYSTSMFGSPTTLRLYAENVTGVRYWAATGSSLLAPGLPKAVKFSIGTSF